MHSLKQFVAAACGAFACVAVLGASAAIADTTYNYVGSPFGGNHEKLGTNMTGSVTFNFDTTGFSGTFDNFTAANAAPVIALQITAGPFTSTFSIFPRGEIYVWSITLTDGEITAWHIEASGSGPFGFNGPYSFNFSDWVSSRGCSCPSAVPFDGFQQVHSFMTGDPPLVSAGTITPGQWFIVPAPAMGAGLPALLAFASFGWWRRRNGSTLSARLN
jgi:hypothetical protein